MRHSWVRHIIHDFAYNPHTQFKFHVLAIMFWAINLIAGTIILIALPHLWLSLGVYYVFLLSIYANADTDYDALSASLAAMHGEAILDNMNKS